MTNQAPTVSLLVVLAGVSLVGVGAFLALVAASPRLQLAAPLASGLRRAVLVALLAALAATGAAFLLAHLTVSTG